MAKFPVDDIRAQNPLVDVVSRRAGVKVEPNGTGEWQCLCPFHSEKTPSFTIFATRAGTQKFNCFGCGVSGDVIDFVQQWENCTFAEACEYLGGKREWSGVEREKSAPREVRDPYAGFKFRLPPIDAPALTAGQRTPPLYNPKRAEDGRPFASYKPSMVFPYRARDGRLVGYVLRVDLDGGKITPTIVWMERPDGESGWCHGALPRPRPPYRCEEIASKGERAQVIIVEGEKAADAAARLFPAALVLTWCGGTNAYDRTKWDLIAGRRVVLWSDNDAPGMKAMLGHWKRDEWVPGLAEILIGLGCDVRLIGRDENKREQWDIADGESEDGWNTADAASYAKANAKPVDAAAIEAHKEALRGGHRDTAATVASHDVSTPRDTPPQIQTQQAKPEPKPEPKAAERETVGNVTSLHGAPIPQGVITDRHGNWRAKLQTNDEGKLRPKSFTNACLMVEHHEEFRDLFVWDEFGSRVVMTRPPSWNQDDDRPYPRGLSDSAVLNLRGRLETKGINITANDVGAAIMVAAENNPVNYVRDYLTGLQWDGEPRLGGGLSLAGGDTIPCWLAEYLGADDSPVNRAFGRRWMIAAVARALDPGCKADNMLILEGPQGLRKSTAFRVLADINGHSYFTDSIDDIHSKDTIQQMQGQWIVEFAELDAMNKAEADSFKKFQTRQDDYVRLPYAKVPQLFPRSCIFGGTINPIGNGYLKDPTGARRYWPVKVRAIDIEALERDREQLIAEAVAAHLAGEQHWLTDAEDDLARVAQAQRLMVDPWATAIVRYLSGRVEVEVREIIVECLSIPAFQQSALTAKRIAGILKTSGWKRQSIAPAEIGGKPVEGWVLIGSKADQGEAQA